MKPTRDEVVEYFSAARTVRCLCYGQEVNISINIQRGIHEYNGNFWIDLKAHIGTGVKLWDKDKGYAEITSVQNRMFGVGEKLLVQIYNGSNKQTKRLIEKQFPKFL